MLINPMKARLGRSHTPGPAKEVGGPRSSGPAAFQLQPREVELSLRRCQPELREKGGLGKPHPLHRPETGPLDRRLSSSSDPALKGHVCSVPSTCPPCQSRPLPLTATGQEHPLYFLIKSHPKPFLLRPSKLRVSGPLSTPPSTVTQLLCRAWDPSQN